MFSDRLVKLRTEKKWTHKFIADRLGITRQAYGMYENGKREPDFETLEKIADMFEVDIDYLLGRTDTPDSSYIYSTKKLSGSPTAHEQSADYHDNDEIVVKKEDSIYTVVARAKKLPPNKVKRMEKLLDLIFDEDEEDE